MPAKTKEETGWILLLLGVAAVWLYGGSSAADARPFAEIYSEIRGLTGTTYATENGIFFLTNERHDLGPGLWFEIDEAGEFVGPVGVS